MSRDFNIINEVLLLLLRWIESLRQNTLKRDLQKKLDGVQSTYMHIKPNGLGGFDIKNMQLFDLNEMNGLCRYLLQMDHDSPLVTLLYDQTKNALGKEI